MMLFTTLCSGAGLRAAPSGRSGALVRFLMLYLMLFSVPGTDAALCVYCGNPFDSVHDKKENCPLIIGPTANAAVMAARSLSSIPKLGGLLPPEFLQFFNGKLISTVVGIAAAPAQGEEIDLSSSAYEKASTIVKAVGLGHCSKDDAIFELTSRLDDADSPVNAQKLQGAIDSLRAFDVDNYECMHFGGRDVLTFLWAKVGELYESTESNVIRLVAGKAKETVSDLVVKLRRPKSFPEFSERLYDMTMILHAFGISLVAVFGQFVKNVVHKTMRRLNESWEVAHELMIVYFKAIANHPTKKLNLSNVYEEGSGDTYLAEARVNAAIHYDSTSGGGGSGGDKAITTWNGKFTATSEQLCVAFNYGRTHEAKSLDPKTGTCKYNHVCMQWVNDKGSGGMCRGNHPKIECTYDASKKIKEALP